MLLDPSRPEVSYLLGLLHTDGWHSGCVDHKGKVGIELHERDVDVLHEIRRVIPCYSALKRRRRRTNFADDYVSYQLLFSDQAVRIELARLGMRPGPKSLDVAPPKECGLVSRAYLRGVLDGDGSVGFTRTGAPFVSLVTASEPMARFFEDQVWQVCRVRRSTQRNTRDGVFNVMVTNVSAALMAGHCWQAGDWPVMARKASAAAEVAAWKPPPEKAGRYGVKREKWTAAQDELLFSHPLAEAAEILGRTMKSVSVRRWRLRHGITNGHQSPDHP